jgi:hypothetical protein
MVVGGGGGSCRRGGKAAWAPPVAGGYGQHVGSWKRRGRAPAAVVGLGVSTKDGLAWEHQRGATVAVGRCRSRLGCEGDGGELRPVVGRARTGWVSMGVVALTSHDWATMAFLSRDWDLRV